MKKKLELSRETVMNLQVRTALKTGYLVKANGTDGCPKLTQTCLSCQCPVLTDSCPISRP